MKANTINFCRNGKPVSASLESPTETLLDYLRLREKATGTKEGCCEGDCGACTVVVGQEIDGEMNYRPINSCITLLGMVNGLDVVTVDDLAVDGKLHPVQQAMVDKHGSQCGFCTPGFVMSLFSLYENDTAAVDRKSITDQLAGNLCRCTGYKPIVEAGLHACRNRDENKIQSKHALAAKALQSLPNNEDNGLFLGDENTFFAQPKTVDELAQLYITHPDATIVAGATDVGLWITKHLADLSKIIHVGAIKDFAGIGNTADGLTISAGATYEQALDALSEIDPDIGALVNRIGSKQVRSAGTIGGNIANGSPIGDMPPLLIALDSKLTLTKGAESRTIPIEDFFIKYGQQDRQAGEFVQSVFIPKLRNGEHLRTYKLSKRFDQDISAVMAAFKFKVDEAGTIQSARIAFGGMAEIPKRAANAEAALTGQSLGNDIALEQAAKSLAKDFSPINDMRASADYRLLSAQGLLKKAVLEARAAHEGDALPASRIIARSTLEAEPSA